MRLRRLVSLVMVAVLAGTYSVISAMPMQNNAAASADFISGEWDATFYAQGTATAFTLELKLEGDKVTGKANSAHTGSGTISKGSWVGNKLSLTIDFTIHEPISLTGGLRDGKLAGEFRTEGFVSKWEAKKKAATDGSSASGDIISGEWDATFDAQGSKAPVTFQFKLDHEKVTGKSESTHMGASTISKGSWADNKLNFTMESANLSIAVTGLLKDGKLVGEFAASNGMKGSWEATKK